MTNSVQIGDKEYDPLSLAIVSIAKNRHGATKNVALNFKGQCMHFTDHHMDSDNRFKHTPSFNQFPKEMGDDLPF